MDCFHDFLGRCLSCQSVRTIHTYVYYKTVRHSNRFICYPILHPAGDVYACAYTYAQAFVRYLSGQFAPQFAGKHRLRAPRRRRFSRRRSRRQRVSIKARKSAKSIARRQKGSAATSHLVVSGMALPAFHQLRSRVLKSFTSSASYLPEVWTYWCKSSFDYYALPEDDSYDLQAISRTRFLSYAQLDLAIARDITKVNELSLVAACTKSNITRDVVVTADEWSQGIFQAVCFIPEKHNGGILYEHCVGIKYQISSLAPFSMVQISPSPEDVAASVLHSVAELFVLFLNNEFSQIQM